MSESRIMRGLAKVGLVELDTPAPPKKTAAELAVEKDLEALSDTEEKINTLSLDEIFEKAGIKPTPFPAEKVLKVLDGLEVKDPTFQRTIISAMSATGDWTIPDIVADATAKIQAIQAAKSKIDEEMLSEEDTCKSSIQKQKEYLKAAKDQIQKQIEDLLSTIKSEEATVEKDIATLESNLRDKATKVYKSVNQMSEQEKRFQGIISLFPPEVKKNG